MLEKLYCNISSEFKGSSSETNNGKKQPWLKQKQSGIEAKLPLICAAANRQTFAAKSTMSVCPRAMHTSSYSLTTHTSPLAHMSKWKSHHQQLSMCAVDIGRPHAHPLRLTLLFILSSLIKWNSSPVLRLIIK